MNEKVVWQYAGESFGHLSWQIPAFFQLDFVFCVQGPEPGFASGVVAPSEIPVGVSPIATDWPMLHIFSK